MPPILGRASVIDGDTIEIRGQRIRLFGIDAPEGRQTCTDVSGALPSRAEAAQVPDYRISEGVVTCKPKDRDRYGRVVAVCRAYGEDLSAFRRYGEQYVPAEDLARRRKPACGAANSCRRGSEEPRPAGGLDFRRERT